MTRSTNHNTQYTWGDNNQISKLEVASKEHFKCNFLLGTLCVLLSVDFHLSHCLSKLLMGNMAISVLIDSLDIKQQEV